MGSRLVDPHVFEGVIEGQQEIAIVLCVSVSHCVSRFVGQDERRKEKN